MEMELIHFLMVICILVNINLVYHNKILGKPNGYGQYKWKNGSSYIGEFQNGLKFGFGKYRKSKANQTNMYEGQYFKDKKHGFGIAKWASGNVYRGQYKEDEREGIGEMKWIDGSLYIGQWERGIQNGFGRMKFPDGTIKEGLFENNVYKGPVHMQIPRELSNPDFDIMSLAPPGISFSGEICYWNPSVGFSNKLHGELPLFKTKRSNGGISSRYPSRPLMQSSYKPNLTQQLNKMRRVKSSARSIKRIQDNRNPQIGRAHV